jgi:hypothetical protein
MKSSVFVDFLQSSGSQPTFQRNISSLSSESQNNMPPSTICFLLLQVVFKLGPFFDTEEGKNMLVDILWII